MENSPEIDVKKIIPILEEFKGTKGTLVPILQKIEEIYGYLPQECIYFISKELKIPVSKIFGVMTFYAQFHLMPKGRNIIRSCQGTACHVNGSKEVLAAIERELGIKAGETTKDLKFTLESVACLGTCFLSPVIMINNDYYGNLTPKKIPKILKQYD